jgi:HEAT repeat protein
VTDDAVRNDRLTRAAAALAGASERARRDAVITIAALGGADAYEPLVTAVRDSDRKVRFNAMLGLMSRDSPDLYADAILAALASHDTGPPEAAAAREVINLRVGPGVLTKLGLAERLEPEIQRLAREGGWRTRRQAGFVARGLRPRLGPQWQNS